MNIVIGETGSLLCGRGGCIYICMSVGILVCHCCCKFKYRSKCVLLIKKIGFSQAGVAQWLSVKL